MDWSLTPAQEDALCQDALSARTMAYAPYSRFEVGAAVLCQDGVVVPGCNVENASYGLCICAERTAISAVVSQGRRAFVAIAVATASSPPSPPCGMCRQVMAEFGPELPIVLVNPQGERARHLLSAPLPGMFTPALLAVGRSK